MRQNKYKGTRIPRILNLRDQKKDVIDHGEKYVQDVLNILEYYETEIQKLKEEIPSIIYVNENCTHDFIPDTVNSIGWFNVLNELLYNYTYKCKHCGKTFTITQETDEPLPDGFVSKPRITGIIH